MRPATHILVLLAALITSAAGLRAQSSFWRQLDQPFGGTVGAFIGGADGSILTDSEGGGIMRSTDDGVTWAPFGPGGEVRPVLYSSRRTLFGIHNSYGWLYRAVDTASEWSTLPVSGGRVPAPMIETNTGAIILASDNGIDRSTDDGLTWTSVASSSGLFRFPVRGPGDTLFAVADRADVYRSSDDGLTWVFTSVLDNELIISLQPLDDGSVVVGSYNGLYRSIDAARSFRRLAMAGAVGTDGGLARLDARTVVAATTNGAYLVDTDGTATPIQGVPRTPLASVHVTRTGAILLGYRGRGILRSTDRGLTFDAVGLAHGWDVVFLNEGPGGAMYASASGSALNPDVGAFFRSTDRGLSWVDLRLYSGHPYVIVASRDGLLVGLGGRSLYRSIDDGITWTTHAKPAALYDLVVTRDGAIVGSTDRGVLRSTDDGETWTTVAVTEHLYDIGSSPGGELWAIGTKLHRSTDDGRTWLERPISAPRMPSGGYRSLALPIDGVLVLLAHESLPMIARSTDGGESWDTTGFGCWSRATMMRDFRSLGMYIVSDCGVAMSRDAGASWTVLAPKPRGERWGTVLAHSGGDLYFAGWTGIHVGTPPAVIRPVSGRRHEEPTITARSTPGGTLIECRLSAASQAVLTVVSIAGEPVTTLFSGMLQVGEHRFDLGEGLPTGAYVVSLRSAGTTRSVVIAIAR